MKVFNKKNKSKKKNKKFVVKFSRTFVIDLENSYQFQDFIDENELEGKEVTEKMISEFIAQHNEDAAEAYYDLIDYEEKELSENLEIEKYSKEKEKSIIDIAAILEQVSEVQLSEIKDVMVEKGMLQT